MCKVGTRVREYGTVLVFYRHVFVMFQYTCAQFNRLRTKIAQFGDEMLQTCVVWQVGTLGRLHKERKTGVKLT